MLQLKSAPLRRREDVIAQRVGETAVLVNLSSNRIYQLNATGARVWELLAAAPSLEGLVGELSHEFEIDREALEGEVAQIVGEFAREGLVEHVAKR